MELNKPKKSYPFLDFARLYCAFIIVARHAYEIPVAGSVWGLICNCFLDQAVPFFFILSGFFFAKKIEACDYQLRETWRYVRDRLLLYAAWAILWLPYFMHIYTQKYAGASVAYILVLLVRCIVFVGANVFWYVLVMAEAALVIGLLMHWRLEKLLYVLAAVGLVLRYCYDLQVDLPVVAQINQAVTFVFSWSNNVIMVGVPFMTLGLIFARYRLQEKAVPGGLLIAVYAVVTCVQCVLYYTVGTPRGSLSCSFLYPFQTISMFWFGLRATQLNVKPQTALAAREISAVIYFMHTAFIYGVFDRYFGVETAVSIKYFGTIALCIATYAFVRALNFRPLHWLFGMKYTKRILRPTEETV